MIPHTLGKIRLVAIIIFYKILLFVIKGMYAHERFYVT